MLHLRSLLIIALIVSPLSGYAIHPPLQPDLSDFEPVLLPLHVSPILGAHGTVWRTVLKMHNASPEPLRYFPGFCGAAGGICELEPGQMVTGPVPPSQLVFSPGRFVYIQRRFLDTTSFSLHVQEQSLKAGSWGTEIPVIRQSDLRGGRFQLLNVPTDPRFRLTLRIYDFEGRHWLTLPKPVAVRVFTESGVLLHEESYRFSGFGFVVPEKPLAPAYVEIVPFATSLQGEGDLVRVEIEPVSEEIRFWAFISITDNVTQEVTTITPQ